MLLGAVSVLYLADHVGCATPRDYPLDPLLSAHSTTATSMPSLKAMAAFHEQQHGKHISRRGYPTWFHTTPDQNR